MFDNTKKYRVTGRYMDGKNLVGYHIVAVDDESIQSRETRDRIIYLIGHGNIVNMRTQRDENGNIIIRGKETNLNNLPVYDIGKDKYRNTDISQQAANSHVNVSKKIEYANAMGQYRITKRVMFKNNCIGYEIVDYSGKTYRKNRDTIIKLASQRLIANATVQRYNEPGKAETRFIIRGADCDLSKLPILISDEKGNITDPKVNSKGLNIRVAFMKNSGILRENTTGRDIKFKAGDFIVCNADGSLAIVSKEDLANRCTKDSEASSAICDNYLNNVNSYSIEIFGMKPVPMSPKMIKNWVIMRNK